MGPDYIVTELACSTLQVSVNTETRKYYSFEKNHIILSIHSRTPALRILILTVQENFSWGPDLFYTTLRMK